MNSLEDPEVQRIIQEDNYNEMMGWVKHHLGGDWFTSELLRLIAKADPTNLARLRLAYPSVVDIWYWYKTGENPRHRDDRHRLAERVHNKPYVHPDEERVL